MTTSQRFASVWDALQPVLERQPMTTVPPDLKKRGVTSMRHSETAGWIATGPGWLICADEINTARDWLRQRRRLPKQHQLMALYARDSLELRKSLALFGEARAPPE